MTGFPAFAIAALIEDDRMRAQLQRLAERGTHPQRVAALAQTWASIRKAADEWLTAETSRVSVPDPAALAGSPEEISTALAAVALGVTESRVRQRLRAGELTGRRIGCRWRVNAAAVRRQAEG